MKKGEPFYLILKDNDTKEFNIVGPMSEAKYLFYEKNIVEEQKKGRNVTCDTSVDKEGAIVTFTDYGFKYAPEKEIIG